MEELSDYELFVNATYQRLRKGAEEYGNESFSASPLELITELKEEVLDIAGWGYILWQRLDRMEREFSRRALEERDD